MKNQSCTSVSSPVEKVQHTPGKWTHEIWEYPNASRPRKELNVVNGTYLIASISWDEGRDNPYTIQNNESFANARLIAAAPDLLEALQAMLTIRGITTAANHEGLINCDILAKARAAIASAIGA